MPAIPLRYALATTVAALLVVALAHPVPATTSRVLGDWTASCWPGERRCAAESDATDRTVPYRLTLSISRADRPASAWQAGLRLHNITPAPDSAIVVRIDGGAAFSFAAGSGYARARSGRSVTFRSDGTVIDLLRAVRAGTRAEVRFTSRERGETAAEISLRGTADALDWINAQQRREHDPSRDAAPIAANAPAVPAETAKTPAPPERPASPAATEEPPSAARTAAGTDMDRDTDSAADMAPAPPAGAQETETEAKTETEAASLLPAGLLDRHHASGDCDRLGSASLAGHAPSAIALPGGKTLYLVPCIANGTTVASRLYLARDAGPAPARSLYFANFSATLGWYGSDTLVNVAWDAATRTLSAQGEGGGRGGCGNAARYRWDGFDFRMLEYRAWARCDGIRTPAQWPVIYRAEDLPG